MKRLCNDAFEKDIATTMSSSIFCWRHPKINRTSHFFLLCCCNKYTYITNKLNKSCLFVTFSMLYNSQVRNCCDILNCILIKLSALKYLYGHVLTINKAMLSKLSVSFKLLLEGNIENHLL